MGASPFWTPDQGLCPLDPVQSDVTKTELKWHGLVYDERTRFGEFLADIVRFIH